MSGKRKKQLERAAREKLGRRPTKAEFRQIRQ